MSKHEHSDIVPENSGTPVVSREEAIKAVSTLIRYIEPEPDREGIRDTAARVIRAWEEHWAVGYGQLENFKPTVFSDGGEKYDSMIVEREIPVWSMCEHHMAPFFGTATVGYIPNQKSKSIIGLSKIPRLVNILSRRLQVQERLTAQIAEQLNTLLAPEGVGVVISCRHTCMETRGIRQPGIVTTTSTLLGSFRDDAKVREEFLALARRP